MAREHGAASVGGFGPVAGNTAHTPRPNGAQASPEILSKSNERTMAPKKLHLGCGSKHIPGFFHVDIAPGDHIDHVGRVEDLGFIASESVELIYSCHVLEHFGRYAFIDVLKEWFRVLAPGGILRLAVPDFAACVKIYHDQGLQDGLSGLIGLISGGQRNDYDYHKMIFDEPFLTQVLLQEVGFTTVRRWDWQKTEHAAVDDYSQAYLPHMDRDQGRLMSLNLEAVR